MRFTNIETATRCQMLIVIISLYTQCSFRVVEKYE